MGIIKILDTHTINKIAAGEVIERPCSVVKELVENSIDAKASSITVEIKNGGIDFIRITDNGVGIARDDVELSFLRHATSKITTSEDLLSVMTLGFRGEALASISAVSHVELITKTSLDILGKKVEVSGGKLESSEEVAAPDGTTIIVRHLFYNVPARKEFLKSQGVETSKIVEYLYKLALAHPEISFKYIQNNKLIFNTSGNHNLVDCIFNIYGRETAKNVYELYYKKNNIEIAGAIGNLSLTRSNRNYEHFFINGRAIKSFLLQRATEDAYKTLVMIGKFPFVIIHIIMDPSLLDVNVHPNKLEVRFKDEDLIYDALHHAILECLNKVNLIPRAALNEKNEVKEQISLKAAEVKDVPTFFTPRKEDNKLTSHTMLSEQISKDKEEIVTENRLFGTPYNEYQDKHIQKEDNIKSDCVEKDYVEDYLKTNHVKEDNKSSNLIIEEAQSYIKNVEYRIIGKLFNTYWLIEYGEKIFLIDQHAAHERVMYEQLMHQFKKGDVSKQILLVPETIDLTPIEANIFKENLQLLFKLGFEAELLGENSLVVREVPFILNAPLPWYILKDILDSLSFKKPKDIAELKEENIIMLSCKKAVKAHDKLTDSECISLIDSLMTLENPFTCPHGRPTLVSLTKYDIEKMFKRV